PLRLVRLARPAPAQLQRLLLERGTLEIPPSELETFAADFCPAVRNVAAIVSSDGSFAPPEISAPRLVFSARYGTGHSVELAWEVQGDPVDYGDVGDSLAIGVSTADVAGERDWFDLGVTITVAGRDVPLGEVFVALARGESHMLLDDGAHFSLLDPRLQSL